MISLLFFYRLADVTASSFVRGTPGGRGLDPENKVTTSESLSAAIAVLCSKLGFGVGATLRGVRRGSGNIVCLPKPIIALKSLGG